ncbi:MAG: hypothetical protein C5S47_00110 [Candidatus Methanogasteraceae archaeon]|nr:MAG: hypothetical protein C5S47_00110 [ANME-2 cluster archaeon]
MARFWDVELTRIWRVFITPGLDCGSVINRDSDAAISIINQYAPTDLREFKLVAMRQQTLFEAGSLQRDAGRKSRYSLNQRPNKLIYQACHIINISLQGDFMPTKIKELLFGPTPKQTVDEYADLVDLGPYEEVIEDEPAETYIRVAELSNLDGIPDLKKELYDGNIVIVDISLIKRDRLVLERALHDLQEVVSDMSGDIAGLGEDLVITTPTGIKIDRSRLGGNSSAIVM